MTAIATPETVNLGKITPSLFSKLPVQAQKDLVGRKDDWSLPLWLLQMKKAVETKNRLSYRFLTPDKEVIKDMDNIYDFLTSVDL